MSKVKLEHERLESTMATAVALFNEWIKWCDANDVGADKMPMIARLFENPAPKQPTNKKGQKI